MQATTDLSNVDMDTVGFGRSVQERREAVERNHLEYETSTVDGPATVASGKKTSSRVRQACVRCRKQKLKVGNVASWSPCGDRAVTKQNIGEYSATMGSHAHSASVLPQHVSNTSNNRCGLESFF